MTKVYSGIISALVTPYDQEGRVNYKAVKQLVRYLKGKGLDGFYVCGTTGEAFLLTQEERKAVLEAVLEENNGEKLVIAHVGSISADFACDLARHASAQGADAVSAIAPFYYKFSPEEITGYYYDIMNAASLPMFMYNFPSLSGFTLTTELLDTFAENPLTAGVKFTSSDFYALAQMKAKHPEMTLWNGMDQMLLSGLAAGADGAIGSTYNVIGPIAQELYCSYRQGDLETARSCQAKINDMIAHSSRNNNLKVVKALLEMEGIPTGGCRRPFTPLKESALADVKYIYEHYVKEK